MILNDNTIAEYIERNRIGIDPSPDPVQVQPASLDVRMGSTLTDPFTDEPLDTLTLRPHRRYHAYTKEKVKLPNDIAAFFTGRSSMGRLGIIVHKTAGWIDPGFEGNIKMELYTFGASYEFEEGERIGQLVFFPLINPSSGYDGQYQGQEGPSS